MRRILFLMMLLTGFTAAAQRNGIIKGVAYDTAAKMPVANATVNLLDKKDSSLVSFSMTDDNGRFEFRDIANGEYRVLITHSGYRNSNSFVQITANSKLADLGNISFSNRSKMLDEVTVLAEAPPVTMIDDTVQYNAGSFKTPPNASAEQLLKKLPGIKVERDGTVKAQGEIVNRVLVDGKEFFGSDPKLATKNLPADAIDKVQVYDRQSDQAQLTGFDDGNYEKTINLKLKKDKKKGMFGKASAAAGTEGRYEGKFNMNSFKGARQLSTIAMTNNSNAEGFSFRDILNFTGELSRMMRNGGGNVNISGNDLSAFGGGFGNNNGIRTVAGGGINYNNIIGTKTDLQSNYFYNRFSPEIESSLQRQYFLPASSYFYKQDAKTKADNDNHRLNINALYQIDSMNSLRITPVFGYQKTNTRSGNNYSTLTDAVQLTNEGFSKTGLDNEGYTFRNDLFFRHKTKKRGRTFSALLQTSLNNSNGNGSLLSGNAFYNTAGTLLSRDTIDQLNKTNTDLKGYTARLTYTEPLGRRSLIELSASESRTTSRANKTTMDYNRSNGKYDLTNALLSNDYNNRYDFTTAGIRMRTQRKKYNYMFGATAQRATLKGEFFAAGKDSVLEKKFDNILPNARFQYNFSRFKSISVNYATQTNQPDISQLQPVPDNRDPLNIRLGNPDLKQEFVHSVQANMNLVSPYKNKNFFVFLSLQSIKNRIVNDDIVNSAGVKYSKPVNTNGALNFNSSISYGFPVKAIKSNIEISNRTAYNKSRQFINGATNNIRAFSTGPELRVDFNPTEKLSIALSTAYNYYHTQYSLQPSLSTEYLTREYSAGIDWEMPKGFFFSTDFYYTVNSGRAKGFNNSLPLWNASLSKRVLKFNRGEIKLSAADLLNSNIGISRSSNQNYIEDSRIKSLRRFFSLGFTYSLNKTGLNNAGEGGGGRVIMR